MTPKNKSSFNKGLVQIKDNNKVSIFIWDLKENKLSKPFPIPYNCFPNGSIYTNGSRMLFTSSENKNSAHYFIDFNRNIFKKTSPLPISFDKIIWNKEQLLGINENKIYKMPYSTLKPKEYKTLKDFVRIKNRNSAISNILALNSLKKLCWLNPSTDQIKPTPFTLVDNMKTSGQSAFGFLKSNNGKIIAKMDMNQGKASVLEVPLLKGCILKPINNDYSSYDYSYLYKYGAHFVSFDINRQLALEYNIPNYSFDKITEFESTILFSKQIKDILWMWVADTKNQTLTILNFPAQLPKGYLNLKNYIVKQTKAIPMPNQKWREI